MYTLNGQTFSKCLVVYMDGDSLLVQDALMKRGFQGGVEAAQNLRNHVMECLSQKSVPVARDLGIVIYVYADFSEMAARTLKPDLSKAAELVRKFCQGFNSAHPWSCYDDMSVSPGRTYQLRESFLQQLSSDECAHVAFVKPTNERFQALMDHQRDNITVNLDKLMAIPLPIDFFRPEEKPMLGGPMKIQVHPPPPELFQASKKSTMLDIFHKASSPTMRYPGKIDHVNTQGESSGSPAQTEMSKFTIPRNRAGQRIDPPTDVSEELVDSVKKKKVCQDHCLRGVCRRKPCGFNHIKLKDQELDALRQCARQRPCRFESECLDASCYWGHMCPWDGKCNPRRCNFPNMHVVDFQVSHYVHQR